MPRVGALLVRPRPHEAPDALFAVKGALHNAVLILPHILALSKLNLGTFKQSKQISASRSASVTL